MLWTSKKDLYAASHVTMISLMVMSELVRISRQYHQKYITHETWQHSACISTPHSYPHCPMTKKYTYVQMLFCLFDGPERA